MNDYVVVILTFGRPNNVKTYRTLREQGYTGNIILICSDDDKSIQEYKKNFPNEVYVFSKHDYKGKFDIADNIKDDRVVVYARNAVFDIMEKLGHKYFLVLDDDYLRFSFIADKAGNYKQKKCLNLDNIFSVYFEYYRNIPAKSICMIQTGDLIGGKQNDMFSGGTMKRKVMNTFFCSTERRFNFVGRINEDTNTYTHLGTKGELFLQLPDVVLLQTPTQEGAGGLTDFYLSTGTYFKSFYTIILAPSCAKIRAMGNIHSRLHHSISWNNCCSKIIREDWKKVNNNLRQRRVKHETQIQ